MLQTTNLPRLKCKTVCNESVILYFPEIKSTIGDNISPVGYVGRIEMGHVERGLYMKINTK